MFLRFKNGAAPSLSANDPVDVYSESADSSAGFSTSGLVPQGRETSALDRLNRLTGYGPYPLCGVCNHVSEREKMGCSCGTSSNRPYPLGTDQLRAMRNLLHSESSSGDAP
jgi:hypothetical protein